MNAKHRRDHSRGVRGTSGARRASVIAASLLLPAAMLAASASAHAGDLAGSAGLTTEVGHSTEAWLDLQRSGAQAAPPQPTLGIEAGLAYARYMDSFRTKIPESLGSLVTKGGSGGTSN